MIIWQIQELKDFNDRETKNVKLPRQRKPHMLSQTFEEGKKTGVFKIWQRGKTSFKNSTSL